MDSGIIMYGHLLMAQLIYTGVIGRCVRSPDAFNLQTTITFVAVEKLRRWSGLESI